MGTKQLDGKLRVAVTQHEPIWLDLKGTVDKTCDIIKEAAGAGAKLLTFPECWVGSGFISNNRLDGILSALD
jgi:predicted amidohydrolase